MRASRLISCTLSIALAACSDATAPSGPPPKLDALPRALSANELRIAGASNQFALNLFNRLVSSQPDSNIFVSPLSVSFALGMTMNGAAGTTLDEMRATLGFGSTELAEINDGYRSLIDFYKGLDATTTFQIANSVWYRQEFPFHESFMQTVRTSFDADVRAANFESPATVGLINDWVSSKTNGKIPEILKSIKDEDVMFLINAIYFKGTWRQQFDPANTSSGTFRALDGTLQQAKLMRRPSGGSLRSGWASNVAVGELDYGNSAFVMTILLPHLDSSVNALGVALDTARWNALVGSLQERQMEVVLPKLRLEYERTMVDDLKALGMIAPFRNADFTRMSPLGNELVITDVLHKTFVDINEEGTEAAAVTKVSMGTTSAPPSFRVDRPFIFVIRERFSGTILFMGKIVRLPTPT